ncbi:MAG: cytochrome c biogenesis protein ResB [Anaerolineae bacterium]
MTVRRALRVLSRVDVAAWLILLALLLILLGSFFPQRPRLVASDTAHLDLWRATVRARYGALTGPLDAAGAFAWFHSPVLWLAAGLLVLAVLVCTVRRWRRTWTQALRRPVRCSDAVLDRSAHAAEVQLPPAAHLAASVRGILEARGFSVRSEADGSRLYLRGDRHRLAASATLLTHTAVLLLSLGLALSGVWGWRDELAVRPGEAVDVWAPSVASVGRTGRAAAEPSLRVRNEGLTILRYADGSAAGYDAQVVFEEGGVEVMRGNLRLNRPLAYRGIRFTLQSFAPYGDGHTVTLHAASDPGYAWVVAAAFLMFIGLTVSLNLPPSHIYVRIEAEGRVQLAGRARRRAWDFGSQFADLVGEISRLADRQA